MEGRVGGGGRENLRDSETVRMTSRPPNNLLNSEEGEGSLMEESKISLMSK